MIIPRTTSPVPLEDRPEEELTPEEMAQLVRQLKVWINHMLPTGLGSSSDRLYRPESQTPLPSRESVETTTTTTRVPTRELARQLQLTQFISSSSMTTTLSPKSP